MSYADRPKDLVRQIGCVGIGLVGTAIVCLMLFGAALGDCGEPGSPECVNDGLIKFLMFPGSLILLIAIGIFAAWRVTKDRD
ncbi:hypothetical protein ACFSTD_07875 [Novosphingobium colocasiae]|uniref:hypothetical protein n=1 Tax=Novosphingobium colocasiae TaxID=1256513 RepID=UPI00167C0E8C|nr:hypothetical protein [Novosphingobium colocasiae]